MRFVYLSISSMHTNTIERYSNGAFLNGNSLIRYCSLNLDFFLDTVFVSKNIIFFLSISLYTYTLTSFDLISFCLTIFVMYTLI